MFSFTKNLLFLIAMLCFFNTLAQTSTAFQGDDFIRVKSPTFDYHYDKNFAVEFIVRRSEEIENPFLIHHFNEDEKLGFKVWIQNGYLHFQINETAFNTNTKIYLNECTQISIILKDEKFTVYKNENVTWSNTYTKTPKKVIDADFYIGGLPNSQGIMGEMDEVRLWYKYEGNILHQYLFAEIEPIHFNYLAAYYQMNAPTAQKISDDTNNGNDGYLGTDATIMSDDPFLITQNCITDYKRQELCSDIVVSNTIADCNDPSHFETDENGNLIHINDYVFYDR